MQHCYYHNSPILSFCTHLKCTLPLCQQCIPIHSQQTSMHVSHDSSRHIVPFDEAKKKAVNWVRADIKDKNQALEVVNNKLKSLRERILKVIDSELALRQHQIDQHFQISSSLQKAQQIEYQIQSGSIKQLIKTYDHYGWIDRNNQSVSCQKAVALTSIEFDFSQLETKLTWKSAGIPKALLPNFDGKQKQKGQKKVINYENSYVPTFQQPQAKTRKGLQIASNLLNDNSEVFSYSSRSNKSPDSWRGVINTKDIYMNSPRRLTLKQNLTPS